MNGVKELISPVRISATATNQPIARLFYVGGNATSSEILKLNEDSQPVISRWCCDLENWNSVPICRMIFFKQWILFQGSKILLTYHIWFEGKSLKAEQAPNQHLLVQSQQ